MLIMELSVMFEKVTIVPHVFRTTWNFTLMFYGEDLKKNSALKVSGCARKAVREAVAGLEEMHL